MKPEKEPVYKDWDASETGNAATSAMIASSITTLGRVIRGSKPLVKASSRGSSTIAPGRWPVEESKTAPLEVPEGSNANLILYF